MADIGARDAFQPALLDRLTDDDRGNRIDRPEDRVVTRSKLRRLVLRDLSWLFNTTAAAADIDAERYPRAARSAVNFGLPAFSGKPLSSLDLPRLESALRAAILHFEPRLLPHSLSVRSVPASSDGSRHNVVSFEIVGELWAQPYPIELLLRTEVDLESGEIDISERR
jgi:type VI secretion system protein ImpF